MKQLCAKLYDEHAAENGLLIFVHTFYMDWTEAYSLQQRILFYLMLFYFILFDVILSYFILCDIILLPILEFVNWGKIKPICSIYSIYELLFNFFAFLFMSHVCLEMFFFLHSSVLLSCEQVN